MARQPNFARGLFTPQNVNKYIGTKQPRYRSGWELAFMRMCDAHPNITKWARENVKIPYHNPATGKYTNYVPDFMIQYTDKDGGQHVELIEIKPRNQTTLESARTQGQAFQTAVNAAKWTAAQEWCKRKGIRFKVINEDQIFQNNKPRKQKRISRRK